MKSVFIVLSLVFLYAGSAIKVYTYDVDAFIDEERWAQDTYYATDKDGKPITGMVRSYYRSGKLLVETFFKDGKTEGIVRSYQNSGELMSETPYKDGKKEGIEKWYYYDGELMYEEPYKEGKLDGMAKCYYTNGKLEYEEPYKDDRINGRVKYYDESSKLRRNDDVYAVFEMGKEYDCSHQAFIFKGTIF